MSLHSVCVNALPAVKFTYNRIECIYRYANKIAPPTELQHADIDGQKREELRQQLFVFHVRETVCGFSCRQKAQNSDIETDTVVMCPAESVG
jgi:hypothetical protein